MRQILFVEDEPLLVAVAKRVVAQMPALEAYDLRTTLAVATSGTVAHQYLSTADAASIGLIILDASLPDCFGIDLLRQIRAAAYPSVSTSCRYVVWSSYACQVEARAAGAHGYISKLRISQSQHTFGDDLLTMVRALHGQEYYELLYV